MPGDAIVMPLLKLAGWIGDAREWLVLIALGAVAGYFYVDARTVRADRDAWAAWGDQVCGFAGATTAPATVQIDTNKGKRKVAKARGQLCREAVRDLAAYQARGQAATAATLAAAQSERETKTRTDLATATAAAPARHRAITKMEKTDAEIGKDDRVDGNWFADLNRLGGLRAP